jgi:hypothetical protein
MLTKTKKKTKVQDKISNQKINRNMKTGIQKQEDKHIYTAVSSSVSHFHVIRKLLR